MRHTHEKSTFFYFENFNIVLETVRVLQELFKISNIFKVSLFINKNKTYPVLLCHFRDLLSCGNEMILRDST